MLICHCEIYRKRLKDLIGSKGLNELRQHGYAAVVFVLTVETQSYILKRSALANPFSLFPGKFIELMMLVTMMKSVATVP